MADHKTLIMIPTYNEAENVATLYEQIAALHLPQTDILFIDDNSPDGTGRILDQLAQQHQGLSVLHRSGKLGIGSAHLHGITYAYEHQYRSLITMDADFTHSPSYIKYFIDAGRNYDIVISSRYIGKDSLQGWNILRKILTFAGHLVTTTLLRMSYDATGAFRLYNLAAIDSRAFGLIRSCGYSFFIESLYILNFNHYSIAEIPISLPARTYGHSKMKLKDITQSVKFIMNIFLHSIFNKKRFLLRHDQ